MGGSVDWWVVSRWVADRWMNGWGMKERKDGWVNIWAGHRWPVTDWTGLRVKRWMGGSIDRWMEMDGWVGGWVLLDLRVCGRVGVCVWVSDIWCSYWLGNDWILPLTTLNAKWLLLALWKAVRWYACVLPLIGKRLEGRERWLTFLTSPNSSHIVWCMSVC